MCEVSHPSTRILHLDDNVFWREQIAGLLEDNGYSVAQAPTVQDAQNHIKSNLFDLYIFDMRLGEKDEENCDGVNLALDLRDAGDETPIVFLTGYAKKMPVEKLQRLTRHEGKIITVEKKPRPTDSRKDDAKPFDELLEQIERILGVQTRSYQILVLMPSSLMPTGVFDYIEEALTHLKAELRLEYSRVEDQILGQPIPQKIQRHLRDCDLVIADITGRNPNVVYELGYAHALGKPAILIGQRKRCSDFGLAVHESIIYDASEGRYMELLANKLEEAVRNTLNHHQPWHFTLKEKPSSPDMHSFAHFIPEGDRGGRVFDNLIRPVVDDLKLSPMHEIIPSAQAYKLDEDRETILKSGVIMANISVPTDISNEEPLPQDIARIFYNTGVADALRPDNLIFLAEKDHRVPLIVKDRSNTIEYEVTPRAVKDAQNEFRKRLDRLVELESTRVADVTYDDTASLAKQKSTLSTDISKRYEATAAAIRGHVQGWSADLRARKQGDIDEIIREAGEWAHAFYQEVKNAKTEKELQGVKVELLESADHWEDDAISQLHV